MWPRRSGRAQDNGEPWAAFADRQGDWGRDLSLLDGRMRCGLTLKGLDRHAGGMGIQAVSKACGRMGEKLKADKGLQRTLARVRSALESGVKESCTMYSYEPCAAS